MLRGPDLTARDCTPVPAALVSTLDPVTVVTTRIEQWSFDVAKRLGRQLRIVALKSTRWHCHGRHTMERRPLSLRHQRLETAALRGAIGQTRYEIQDGATLTVLANLLDQPHTQDPLGFIRAQLDAGRHQAGTGALAFDTRKSIAHQQGGVTYQKQLSTRDTVRVRVYGSNRQATQMLAFSSAALGFSGEVVD